MKRCSKCGETKPLEFFHVLDHGPQGRHSHCKECRNPYVKQKTRERRMKERKHG